MDFNTLKNKKSSTEKLTKALNALATQNGGGKDTRFWQPEVDKAGNGYAVIRFLDAPAVDGEDGTPWSRVFNHGFKGPQGTWFIENCPTTLGTGHKCPVCESNSKLWNSGIESNKKIVSERKRKISYYSNILVITDPTNPENEGKVFLFRYGQKIFEKVAERIPERKDDGTYETHDPLDPDFKKFNPFNFWEGANFKLKIRNVEGYRNYDKSEFSEPAPLFNGDDSEIEKVWKASYSLTSFTKDSEFKPYEELKTKLDRALEIAGKASRKNVEESDADGDAPWDTEEETASSETDKTLDYFSKLAED